MFRTTRFAIPLVAMPFMAFADPLPSWSEGGAKEAIISFVEDVTDPQAEAFVPTPDRIAVFDNDGTLWTEKPLAFQLAFSIDKARQAAEADPSIVTSDALRAAAEGDWEGVAAAGREGLAEIQQISHANISAEAFRASVHDWLTTTPHPTSGKPYAEMTFQPMLELLRYLRDEGFTTYIVSGGSVEFMRAITQETYNIPPSQVIGSLATSSYSLQDGVPTITKDGGVLFLNRYETKPIGIWNHIGKRPIFAAGNSDNDFAMLEWVTSGENAGFGMIVHHTDADREVAYDRHSPLGTLDVALDAAEDRGWLLVDMAQDWDRVWSHE